MNKDHLTIAGAPVSRRTGLDRRWIHSANHQPERRRSRDRRTTRKRSYLEPLDLKGGGGNRELFPEINRQANTSEEKNATRSFDEKGLPAPRAAMPTKGPSDDG
jgi:hypothetical protein